MVGLGGGGLGWCDDDDAGADSANSATRAATPSSAPTRGNDMGDSSHRGRDRPYGRRAPRRLRHVTQRRLQAAAATGTRSRATSAGAPASWPPAQSAQLTSRRGVAHERDPEDPTEPDERGADPHADVERRHRRRLGGARDLDRLLGRQPGDVGARQRALLRPPAPPPDRPARATAGSMRSSSARAELRGDDRAERRDPEQPGRARDRVVDARGDAGVLLVGVGEHRRGQRRHGRRQPDREHEQRGQQLGQVVGVGADAQHQQQAHGRRAARPPPMNQRGAVAVRQRARALGEHEHHHRGRERREPGLERAVAGDLLEEQHEVEEQRPTAPRTSRTSARLPAAKLRRLNSSSGSIGYGVVDSRHEEQGEATRARRAPGTSTSGATQPDSGWRISASVGPASAEERQHARRASRPAAARRGAGAAARPWRRAPA